MSTVKRILRLAEVEHVTGLSRATIYRKMQAKQFPPSFTIAPQTVGWKQQDVEAWIDALPCNNPHASPAA